MVAERKNVSAINRQFAPDFTTVQSCLNRWLTEVKWDAGGLNAERLAWLQEDPSTRYAAGGAIPIDNVLIDHDGKWIDDVGWFWDHAEDRYKVAHDYLIVNYVCPGGKHYPLEFRRFVKEDQCRARGEPFRDHDVLFRELVDWVLERGNPQRFQLRQLFHQRREPQPRPRQGPGVRGDLKFKQGQVHGPGDQGVGGGAWGWGDCQLRDGRGQTRHMYLVFLAYSLLMRPLKQGRASEWALQRLTTVGQACRAVLHETLSQTIDWVIHRSQVDNRSPQQIKCHLALT